MHWVTVLLFLKYKIIVFVLKVCTYLLLNVCCSLTCILCVRQCHTVVCARVELRNVVKVVICCSRIVLSYVDSTNCRLIIHLGYFFLFKYILIFL
jgi:hypothetical protein